MIHLLTHRPKQTKQGTKATRFARRQKGSGEHVKSMMTIEIRDRPEKIHVKSQGEPIEVPRALASVHVKSDLRFGFEL